MTTFPERVWEPTDNGWSSRPATDEDYKRRRLIAELLSSATSDERKKQIRMLLDPDKKAA